jgi:hypothetical protein
MGGADSTDTGSVMLAASVGLASLSSASSSHLFFLFALNTRGFFLVAF